VTYVGTWPPLRVSNAAIHGALIVGGGTWPNWHYLDQ